MENSQLLNLGVSPTLRRQVFLQCVKRNMIGGKEIISIGSFMEMNLYGKNIIFSSCYKDENYLLGLVQTLQIIFLTN